jgi:MoaA/NifB/PqqE/SkfB family radical SAM enzyme
MISLPINSYEIEITSRCNAACPVCARTVLNDANKLVVEDLPYEQFVEIFENYYLDNNMFYFCGTIGDAMTHPKILDIFKFLIDKNANIDVHTNGGTRNAAFWKELAELSKLHKNSNNRSLNVRWNVDGIETNKLYRVNVDINKVLSNMKTYVDHGGKASWYYIVFDWNLDEIDKAKQLADSLNIPFYKREAWRNKNKNLKTMKFIPQNSILDSSEISCKHKERGELFLNVDGTIWPCCFLRDEVSQHTLYDKITDADKIFKRYGNTFNLITKDNTLKNILNHPFYKNELTELGWKEDSEMFLSRCYRSCGDKGNRLAKNIKL